MRYIYAEDSTEIFALYNVLQKGADFDTVVSTRDEYSLQKNPQEVKYGQMAEDVEDALYALTGNNYTQPIYTPAGWYIFHIVNLKQEMTIHPGDPTDRTTQLAKKVLKTRKENERYKQFFYKFFNNKKAEIDAALLRSFAVHLSTNLREKKKYMGMADTTIVSLEPQDAAKILSLISAD